MRAAKRPVRVRSDRVLEEPEAGGGSTAVVEAGHAGVEEHVPERGTGRVAVQVGGGEDVLDVVWLRICGVGRPAPRMDAVGVRRAAGEDVVYVGGGRIINETACQREARRTVGK